MSIEESNAKLSNRAYCQPRDEGAKSKQLGLFGQISERLITLERAPNC